MKTNGLIEKLIEFMPVLADNGKSSLLIDFGILKTMMMLAAVDGNISQPELKAFRDYALSRPGLDDETFGEIWKSALTSAGYLAMQALLMTKDELVAEFIRLVDADFIQRIVKESHEVRKSAFKCLKAMAEADGDYSDVEKSCISELVRIVREKWEVDISVRAAHL